MIPQGGDASQILTFDVSGYERLLIADKCEHLGAV